MEICYAGRMVSLRFCSYNLESFVHIITETVKVAYACTLINFMFSDHHRICIMGRIVSPWFLSYDSESAIDIYLQKLSKLLIHVLLLHQSFTRPLHCIENSTGPQYIEKKMLAPSNKVTPFALSKLFNL